MSGIKVQGSATGAGNFTITPPNGGATDRTITLPNFSGTLGFMGPAFFAWQNVAQTIANSTNTKITLDQEQLDTDNCFDPSLSRFTPQVPGWYFIEGYVGAAVSGGGYATAYIFKNGALSANGAMSAAAGPYQGLKASRLVQMNGTTDYVELYFTQGSGAAQTTYTSASTTAFYGFFVHP